MCAINMKRLGHIPVNKFRRTHQWLFYDQYPQLIALKIGMTGHSTTNHHQLWSKAEGKKKRSHRPRIILRINCFLVSIWLPPDFPNQKSLSGLPVGRMQLPRHTHSKTFSGGTLILNRDSSSSSTALPLHPYLTDLHVVLVWWAGS